MNTIADAYHAVTAGLGGVEKAAAIRTIIGAGLLACALIVSFVGALVSLPHQAPNAIY